MQVKKINTSATQLRLTVSAAALELESFKKAALKRVGKHIKVSGFREGKAPAHILEKQVDQNAFQTEFLELTVSQLYVQALEEEKIRPISRPEVTIKKFVPFTEIEFDAEVEIIGDIKLADYTKIIKTRLAVKITDKDIDAVIDSLLKRAADKKAVDRAAKDGDEVIIDFSGTDAKGVPVKGATGKDYPLLLGSNAFIPGFEANIYGLKSGEEKTFTIPFPKDYGVKALQGKKVTFAVKVIKVNEIIEPKLDAEFAAKVGPFKTVDELKEDVKKQLIHEREHEADRELENELVQDIISKSTLHVPKTLIEDQVQQLLAEVRQNLMYRGQTFEEMLEMDGKTEEQYRKEDLEPRAIERVKAGLVLGEIADKEQIMVTPEELEQRIQALKTQYTDQQMQAELDKEDNRRDIASRLLTEKTVNKLVIYATGRPGHIHHQ